MEWEFEVSRCQLIYIGLINKILLYSTGNYIQHPVINHKGKYMCICIICVCVYIYISESPCCISEINTAL